MTNIAQEALGFHQHLTYTPLMDPDHWTPSLCISYNLQVFVRDLKRRISVEWPLSCKWAKYYIRFWGDRSSCLKMQTTLLCQFSIVCTLTDSFVIFQYLDYHLTAVDLVDILSKYSSSLEIENCHESKRMHAEILCGMESLQVTCNNMSP